MKISITLDEIRKKFNLPEDAEISIETENFKKPFPLTTWSNLLKIHQQEKLHSIYPQLCPDAIRGIIGEIKYVCEDINLDDPDLSLIDHIVQNVIIARELDPTPFRMMLKSL